jgi:hypothetical protein
MAARFNHQRLLAPAALLLRSTFLISGRPCHRIISHAKAMLVRFGTWIVELGKRWHENPSESPPPLTPVGFGDLYTLRALEWVRMKQTADDPWETVDPKHLREFTTIVTENIVTDDMEEEL